MKEEEDRVNHTFNLNELAMDSDPNSVNATDKLKKKQDDDQPKDLKMKEKVEDLDNQAKDLKMKQKVEDLHKDSSYDTETVEGFKVPVLKGRKMEDRTRLIITDQSPEVIDQLTSDLPLEPLKLVGEIVRIYTDYIDHISAMAEDRLKDEQRWNFDRSEKMCSGLPLPEPENFSQKMEILGSELEGMKTDFTQTKNYSVLEPRVRQIMNQLVQMHLRFDRSLNISASLKPANCTREELILCLDEINQCRKELYAITLRVNELKTIKMHEKTMEIKRGILKIL